MEKVQSSDGLLEPAMASDDEELDDDELDAAAAAAAAAATAAAPAPDVGPDDDPCPASTSDVCTQRTSRMLEIITGYPIPVTRRRCN